MYIKGHVKTVNTKDQSNTIVYSMFVNTVNMKIKAHNALNAMFVETVDTGVCCSYTNTVYRVMRCKNSALLSINWPLVPPRGRLLYCAFRLVGLAVHQSEEATLLTFLDLSTTRVIEGKMHSQSPILKTKGVLSNPVTFRYLREQSCILHTLTKLPACNLEPKSIFNA